MNAAVDYLLENLKHVRKFHKTHNLLLKDFFDKDFTAYVTKLQEYMTRKQYIKTCQVMFSVKELTSPQESVCFELMARIRQQLMQEQVETLETVEVHASKKRKLTDNLTDGARSKIRHVGGYCVAKVRHRCMQAVNRNLYKTDEKSEIKYVAAKQKVRLLNEIILKGDIKSQTEDMGSLKETERKQNVRSSLVNITDKAFNFCTSMCAKILQQQSMLSVYGQHLFEYIFREITEDNQLKLMWLNLFTSSSEHLAPVQDLCEIDFVHSIVLDVIENSLVLLDLFHDISNLFLSVMIKQLKTDYVEAIREKKEEAHRVNVKIKSSKKAKEKLTLNWESILKDSSDQKDISHHLLKGICMKDPRYFTNSSYTRKQMMKLCEAYDIKIKKQDNKIRINDKLVLKIKNEQSMLYPTKLGSDTTGATSTGTSVRMPLQPLPSDRMSPQLSTSGSENDDDSHCYLCGKHYNEEEEWIMCDICQKWFHRKCAKLSNKKRWEYFSSENVDFKCQQCQ